MVKELRWWRQWLGGRGVKEKRMKGGAKMGWRLGVLRWHSTFGPSHQNVMPSRMVLPWWKALTEEGYFCTSFIMSRAIMV